LWQFWKQARVSGIALSHLNVVGESDLQEFGVNWYTSLALRSLC
jgi:hypothetical protein